MDIYGSKRKKKPARKPAKKLVVKILKDSKGKYALFQGKKYRIGKKVKRKELADFFKRTVGPRKQYANSQLAQDVFRQGEVREELTQTDERLAELQFKSRAALVDELKSSLRNEGLNVPTAVFSRSSKAELANLIVDVSSGNIKPTVSQLVSQVSEPVAVEPTTPKSQIPPVSPAVKTIREHPSSIRPKKAIPKTKEQIEQYNAAALDKAKRENKSVYVGADNLIHIRRIPDLSKDEASSSSSPIRFPRGTSTQRPSGSPSLQRLSNVLESAREEATAALEDIEAHKQADDPLNIHGSGKDRGMSDIQINKLMSPYPEYLGCIAHDQIDSKILPKVTPKSRLGFVINTDPHNKPGQHWQAVYVDGRPEGSLSVEFFDSFGDKPDKTVMAGLHKIAHKIAAGNYLKYKHNRIQYQSDRSSNCGFFACKFLIDRFRNKPFAEASGFDSLSQVKGGERAIERFKHQHGFGQYFKSFGTGLIDPRSEYPPSVRRQLDNQTVITSIKVGRTPVQGYINTVLNAVSLGGWNSAKKSLGFSEAFHLYLVINDKWKLERNHVISWSDYKQPSNEIWTPVVPLNKQITVSQLLKNTQDKYGPEIQVYDAATNNCQVWCLQVLEANGLLTQPLKTFIFQNIEQAFEKLPFYVRWLARQTTDLAHSADIIVKGRGKII